MPKGRKRYMRKFEITELSGVDVPAQEGARSLIMKRGDPVDPAAVDIIKQAVADYLRENPGDTKETEMDPKAVEALQKVKDRLEKIVALSAEHRAHFDGLDTDDAKDEFLAKSGTERDGLIAEAKKRADEEEARKNAEDPVVYTAADGTEIRKSDGNAVLAMAKRQDAQAKELADEKAENEKLRKAAETAGFEKRAADELANLPGSLQHRASLLKAAEGIEDEDARKAAVDALRAGSTAMSPMFATFGKAGAVEPDAGDPQVKLDALAKKHQEANAGMSFEAAQAAVLDTAEGKQLYEEQLRQAH